MIDRLLGGDDDSDSSVGGDEPPDSDLFGDDFGEGAGDLAGDLGLEGDEENDENLDELQHRVSEFEEEFGSLSSSLSSIQNENEQLTEEVQETREHVRKLLDIYEMVTQGVNPFVEEDAFGEAFEESSIDVFDTADDRDEAVDADEDLDQSDALFDEPGEDDAAEDDRSFEELKDSFGADEPAWSGDDERAEGQAPDTEEEPSNEDHDTTSVTDPSPPPASPTQSSTTDSDQQATIGEKPYLRTLPMGYSADIIVMRWLEYLLDQTDDAGAADTIEYYRAIEWVSDSVADRLLTFLEGLGDGDTTADAVPRSGLDIDQHTQSLQFIHQLAVISPDPVVLTGEEQLVDELVTADAHFAQTAVPPAPTFDDSFARTDGGPANRERSQHGLPRRWIKASDRLVGIGGEWQ